MLELNKLIELSIPALTGLLGVFIGSWLNKKTSISVQKKFLAKQTRIEKMQGASERLSHMVREVAYPFGITQEVVNEYKSLEEAKSLIGKSEERMLELYREIRVYKIYLKKDFQQNIERFYSWYNNNAINLNIKIERNNLEQIHEDLFDEVYSCAEFGFKIVDDLNKELSQELEALED